MRPTYTELLSGCTTWKLSHKGISFQLSFHDYSEGAFPHPGTWCYYLLLDDQMFYDEDWKKLLCATREYKSGNNTYRNYCYETFPDLPFHGGVTWYSVEKCWNPKLAREVDVIKVGCDYVHIWDSEAGYPDTFDTVKWDAESTIDALLELFPRRRVRCEYSGIYDSPEKFYIAENGARVHVSQQECVSSWELWLPFHWAS